MSRYSMFSNEQVLNALIENVERFSIKRQEGLINLIGPEKTAIRLLKKELLERLNNGPAKKV